MNSRLNLFSAFLMLFCFLSPAYASFWDVPIDRVKAQTVRAYDRGPIRVEEIYYQSRPYKNKPVKIFGYFCYPRGRGGRWPAILLSHGGGGVASLPRAVSWARRGYAVLAIDLPGKGEKRLSSRSTGPDLDVPILLRVKPDPSYNYLVHAVAALRCGITYLTQRMEVDQNRIGMVGLSWGGVLTILVNGQDDRLAAAVNVFGSGYLPEGSTWEDRFLSMSSQDIESWNNDLDPKNFLTTQHAPILFISGTNDHCYYLPPFQKSYSQVKSLKSLWLIPNLKHHFLSSSQDPALTWLNQHLKSGGTFPAVHERAPFFQGAGQLIISVTVEASVKIQNVRLYYSPGAPLGWTTKKWRGVSPFYRGGTYYFNIPVALLKPELLYYINVQDRRGGVASTLVRSLFAVKHKDGRRTVAYSAPIQNIFRHEPPIVMLDGYDARGAHFVLLNKERVYRFEPRVL